MSFVLVMLNATDENTRLARGLGCVGMQGHVHCCQHSYCCLEHVPQGVKTMLCLFWIQLWIQDVQNVASNANTLLTLESGSAVCDLQLHSLEPVV